MTKEKNIMRHVEMIVTPGMALDWWEKANPKNRRIKRQQVNRYARDMAAGEWKLTHQSIAFDVEGQLVDGHHRLLAIQTAGVPAPMLVCFDAPRASYDHLDIGTTRTATDIMRARGTEATAKILGTAKFLEVASEDPTLMGRSYSPFEVEKWVEFHREAIRFAMPSNEHHTKGVTVAPVIAAIGSAWYHYGPDQTALLAEFRDALYAGTNANAMIIRYRDQLMTAGEEGAGGSQKARLMAYRKTQRVIKAHMEGQHLSSFYTPPNALFFPPRLGFTDIGTIPNNGKLPS